MKFILKVSVMVGLAILVLGCGTATTAPSAPQPGTEAPAPVPPTPSALGVAYNNVSFTVPFAMADTVTYATTTAVEFPYINPSGGPMPEHIVFNLNGYAREAQYSQPSVLVYPAAEYAQYSDLTQGIIDSLQTLQVAPGQPLPQALINGVISAQVQEVQFQSGRGVRYLTQVNQVPVPINSKGLFYYFQGLTTDGRYFVQVILPVYAPFLPTDDSPNSPAPADGVPFDWNNYNSLPQYLDAVTQKLNTAVSGDFTPRLAHLDKLVQSILVNP